MEKVTDEYAVDMYKDVETECVFNLAFSIYEEYSIYHLNYNTYLHHLFRNGSTEFYISHKPDSDLIEQFFEQADIDTDSDTVVTVNRLDLNS